ncbi:hypothetical protein ACHAXR_007075 [Thalassiosira sp. AJA248-18]
MKSMVDACCQAVSTLSKVAAKYPQSAYVGFTYCLQNEWQYVARVTSDIAPFFEGALEQAIRNEFLPVLFGVGQSDIDHEFREGGGKLWWHRNSQPNGNCYSFTRTRDFPRCLQYPHQIFNRQHLPGHCSAWQSSKHTVVHASKMRVQWGASSSWIEEMSRGKPAVHRMASGAWLTAIPNVLHGTILSAEEFRDILRLSLNLAPLEMLQLCDG